MTFQALNATQLLKAKLSASISRGAERDFEDVEFLLINHGEEISQHLEILDGDDVVRFLESEDLDEERRAEYAEFFGMGEQ